jgi:hypothetical protein
MDATRQQTTDKTTKANGGAVAGVKSVHKRSELKSDGPQRAAEDALAQVKNTAGEIIEQSVSAAGDALTSIAADLGDQAQDIAGRVLDQAGATAKTLQQEARRVGAASGPLTTLLVAGAVGYALAYLVHRR